MTGDDAFVPEHNSLWSKLKRKANRRNLLITGGLLVCLSVIIGGGSLLIKKEQRVMNQIKNYVPDITIPSMDLIVLNITETHLSVKGDLFIRIPHDLPGHFMCLKGDFQVLILYKNVTIATSSIESYNLIPEWAQLLNVSSIASDGNVDGMVGNKIMEDIKERDEIRFVSRVILTDCRYGTNGKMNYMCDEASLRFEPCSQRMATLFGVPTCHYVH